jgi:DNA polymerase (family X)
LNINKLISDLNLMGHLLELDGANPFKSAAYPKAARTLMEYDGDLEEAILNNTLTKIKGIGKGIAEKIDEFYHADRIVELEHLRERIPAGVLEFTRVPGLGAKKAGVLYKELGLTSLEELRQGCENGSIAKLKGFSNKSVERILKGIEEVEKYSGRHRLDVALIIAEAILNELELHPEVIKAEIAGSLRRRKETVGDIDIVVATENPLSVMEYFTSLPYVGDVIGHGETKSSVMLDMGIQADLRCVSLEQFPYTLMHFTGSKEHNTKLRQLAKEKNLKLNEYGLFPEGEETPLPADTEGDIHNHLGLQFIRPEMREDLGEVEVAQKDELPKTVEREEIKGVFHMHTVYSDGKATLPDYSKWAEANNVQWMGITDHSQSLSIASGMKEAEVLEQHREIDEVNERFEEKGIRLLKGIESDILVDGSLDYSREFLPNFEFIIASIHSHFNLTEKEQTMRLCKAAENPFTTIIGHLTGRLILSREGYPVDQKEVLRVAGQHGVAIEINSNPWRLDLDWRLLRYAVEQGCKIAISPDAHSLDGLDDLEFGFYMAAKGWVTPDVLLNCLSAEDFVKYAAARR